MQILVIAVGDFGINVACQLFSHLVVEHKLLDSTTGGLHDYSLFFSECGPKSQAVYRANLLLLDSSEDPYLTVIKSHPLLVPFLNRTQVFQMRDLPGVSQFHTVSALKKSVDGKDVIRDCLKRELEKKCFQTVLVFHAIGGGTGSGLTQCILSDLQVLKSKSCSIVNFMLLPSSQLFSTNNLEWYNAAASLETINDACDLTVMLDNEALYRVHQQSILGNGVDDKNLRVHDLNHLIVALVCSITGSQRYKSQIQKRFQDIIVNTVLYRCIHFVVPSIFDARSLVQNYGQVHRDNEIAQSNSFDYQFHQTQWPTRVVIPQAEVMKRYSRFKFSQPRTITMRHLDPLENYSAPISILVDLFDKRNVLATCGDQYKPYLGVKDKYVSCFTSFNAPHTETLINQAFIHTREYLSKATQIDFMSMSPCPTTFSLTGQSVLNFRQEGNTAYTQEIELGATMLQNKFTIHHLFDRMHKNVTRMYQRGAYNHWIDSAEMQHHIDTVKCLERDYGDWFQAEEIVHLFEESMREDEVQSQSDSLSDTF